MESLPESMARGSSTAPRHALKTLHTRSCQATGLNPTVPRLHGEKGKHNSFDQGEGVQTEYTDANVCQIRSELGQGDLSIA